MRRKIVPEAQRDRCLKKWGATVKIAPGALSEGERWVVFAALTFLTFVGRAGPFRRLVAYWLSHCGLDLSSKVVGAVVGTTDRAVREGRRLPPEKLWQRLKKAPRGHRRPKLSRGQVGPIAKYLAEHKRCSVAELLAFIQETFGVVMDRLTLRRFLERYGLGCLREEAVKDTPRSAGRTMYGGAFVLLEDAVDLYQRARACFAGLGAELGGRLVLSLFFKAVLGIRRIFHFDSLSDIGLAWLTGGPRVLSRNKLGGLVRAASTRAVGKFIRRTRPLVETSRSIGLSIDEHVVARFTRKFRIPKGFHTIRNKKMRAEKLFFSFDTGFHNLLDLIVTPGNGRLARVASQLLHTLGRRVRSGVLRVILDAGAAQNHRDLFALVDQNRRHVLLVRAPRRRSYLDIWKALPEESFTPYEEPGRYKGAPPKHIGITETTTPIRPDKHSPTRQVRTIVVREQKRSGKKRERWHAIFVFGDDASTPLDIVKEFRTRQRHEQTYRILLHDACIDTAPSGYSKHSRNPDRPGFRKNAITLYAWLAGLAVNALKSFTETLPERYHRAHPRTLRRWWLNVYADLYLGNGTLIVIMRPRWFRGWWAKKIKRLNDKKIRVPWMDNRLVIYSLGPPISHGAEPPIDPPSE